MAFSKEQKTKLIDQYTDWVKQSQGMVALSYNKMSMKEIDTLRSKVREAGGELHVVKNTLMKLALDGMGVSKTDVFEGVSLVGFAFHDAPALAKVIKDSTAKSEIFAVKGGYLGNEMLDASQIKALADLPPLPVMRATLLGTILAPASKLVRTLAEPARGLAAVVKAYSESGAAAAV
ncbi:MAG TPA: 50S ribosomal protein L10 [Bellilinea sp.]|nr:50S ribosomal protein L10 [Bellilinea sp.]